MARRLAQSVRQMLPVWLGRTDPRCRFFGQSVSSPARRTGRMRSRSLAATCQGPRSRAPALSASHARPARDASRGVQRPSGERRADGSPYRLLEFADGERGDQG
jgi:hypothetical protein